MSKFQFNMGNVRDDSERRKIAKKCLSNIEDSFDFMTNSEKNFIITLSDNIDNEDFEISELQLAWLRGFG